MGKSGCNSTTYLFWIKKIPQERTFLNVVKIDDSINLVCGSGNNMMASLSQILLEEPTYYECSKSFSIILKVKPFFKKRSQDYPLPFRNDSLKLSCEGLV